MAWPLTLGRHLRLPDSLPLWFGARRRSLEFRESLDRIGLGIRYELYHRRHRPAAGAAHRPSCCRSSCWPRGAGIETHWRGYAASLLLLTTGMLAALFMARDLFLFYVFWEVMLVPMYLIIGIWGGDRRIYAAVKFFLFTMAGQPADAGRHHLDGVLQYRAVVCSVMWSFGNYDDLLDPARHQWGDTGRGMQLLALRRLRAGLRHQGADVPVPHLAARTPTSRRRPAARWCWPVCC